MAEAAGRLRAAVGAVTARRLIGSWWRQGAVGYPLASLPETARSAGRYHRRGQRPVLYASDSERAAWAELLRHHQSPELDPFHIRRRVGRLELHDLAVLDVTAPAVLDWLGLSPGELTAEDRATCQALADAADEAGFDGILAPSAALTGARIIAVFPRALAKVTMAGDRVQRPPRSLLAHLSRIRFTSLDVAAALLARARRRPRGSR